VADDKNRDSDAPERADIEQDKDDEQAAEAEGAAASDDEERDEAAQRVAEALGIEGEGEEQGEADKAIAEASEPEAPAPKNRAARRREGVEQRRRKRKGAEAEAEALPKDKNARAKELLRRRREQASSATVSSHLLPSEMVDDALARSTSAVTKWLRTNFGVIQWFILATLVAGGGFLVYTSQLEKKADGASDTLMTGVESELGVVMPEDKRSEEDKEFFTTKVFKTAEERSEAALAGYQKTIAEYPNTGAAILARLGEAGVLLDKGDYAKAIEAYNEVIGSKLAAADLDVKGRALEGLGLAKEGSGDTDGALAAFKELEGVDARGFKELGMYQQGRVLLAKGDKDKAKELLKQVYDKIKDPGTDGAPNYYLRDVVTDALRKIDPSAVEPPSPLGGGQGISPEQREKLMKMFQDAAKKGQQQGQGQ